MHPTNERLDRIERQLATLTQWAENTAGQLMYSPRGSAQEPFDGAFDLIDELVRCRAILGRTLLTHEVEAVRLKVTAKCRTTDEVMAAIRATPVHPAAQAEASRVRTGAPS